MPEMDGMKLLMEIRKKNIYRYLPVMLLTTETHSFKKDEARKAGATG
jgi:two-component system, chemotaxis family, chemotaxis protein CheY